MKKWNGKFHIQRSGSIAHSGGFRGGAKGAMALGPALFHILGGPALSNQILFFPIDLYDNMNNETVPGQL